MKTKLTLLILLLATATFAQTMRRVNADATVTGTNVYSTLQAAHDAATAGDILIVEPGATVGNLNCIKTLTIYGRGYFLDKNPSYANLPNNSVSSTVGNISIFASNCKISGLTFGGITVNGGASGTTISRNTGTNASIYITASAGAAINNTLITQNYLSAIYLTGNSTGYITNLTISNNLFIFVNFSGSTTTASANYYTSILINQNTLNLIVDPAGNAVISNNIFLTTTQAVNPSVHITNSTYNNNVSFGTSVINPGLGANNIVISNSVGQFNSNTGGSADNNYRVATGSSIKTASSSGGEVGMFGGATPYVQYGIPASPSIIKLFNTGIGNSTTPITATISATSNN